MKNKLETDFDLQVRYLYFKINFNFICTAKFLTLSDDGRIYFICIFLEFFLNSLGIFNLQSQRFVYIVKVS